MKHPAFGYIHHHLGGGEMGVEFLAGLERQQGNASVGIREDVFELYAVFFGFKLRGEVVNLAELVLGFQHICNIYRSHAGNMPTHY